MKLTLMETFMSALIVAYVLASGVFIFCCKRGGDFVSSFDSAAAKGCVLFAVMGFMDSFVYVLWA